MTDAQNDQIRTTVRDSYAAIAESGGNSGCCLPARKGDSGTDSCCGAADLADPMELAQRFGYSIEELMALPEGANMGLGCGNPAAIAGLVPGEVVMDLGSGGGVDCFLAAGRVGETGRVIGIDMTPEMLAKARDNARQSNFENVEFRLGEIEHIPVADNAINVIISNCVLNLSPDKPQVLRESFRVLAPGGRLAISDVVATAPMPAEFTEDSELLCGCVSGAATVEDLKSWLAEAGYQEIEIDLKEETRETIKEWAPGRGIEDYVVSAIISAVKPE